MERSSSSPHEPTDRGNSVFCTPVSSCPSLCHTNGHILIFFPYLSLPLELLRTRMEIYLFLNCKTHPNSDTQHKLSECILNVWNAWNNSYKGLCTTKQKVDDVLDWPMQPFLAISAMFLLGGKVLTHGEESVFTLSLLLPRACSPWPFLLGLCVCF